MNEKKFGVFSTYKPLLDEDEEELIEFDPSLDEIIQSDLNCIEIPISPELVSVFEWNLFFDVTDSPNDIFHNYQYEYHSLFLYYLYSTKFIGALKKSYEIIKEESEEPNNGLSAEAGDLIAEASFTYEDALPLLSNQSIVMMLYSSFEQFLGRLAEDIANSEGLEFLDNLYYGSQVDKYLQYLNKTVGMKCYIPRNTMNMFNAFRKVRNYYTHSSKTEASYEQLTASLRRLAPTLVINDRIPLNHSFIMSMFKSIAEMIKIIAKAYWEHYDIVHMNKK